MPPAVSSAFESERAPVIYVHTVSEAGRLLPSASQWNSIALDFKLAPHSSTAYESIPSQYPKSVDYDLVITDRKHFHCFIFVLVTIILAILAAVLLVHFLPQKHKHQGSSINLKVAINQALTFYDAQKCNTSICAATKKNYWCSSAIYYVFFLQLDIIQATVQ